MSGWIKYGSSSCCKYDSVYAFCFITRKEHQEREEMTSSGSCSTALNCCSRIVKELSKLGKLLSTPCAKWKWPSWAWTWGLHDGQTTLGKSPSCCWFGFNDSHFEIVNAFANCRPFPLPRLDRVFRSFRQLCCFPLKQTTKATFVVLWSRRKNGSAFCVCLYYSMSVFTSFNHATRSTCVKKNAKHSAVWTY